MQRNHLYFNYYSFLYPHKLCATLHQQAMNQLLFLPLLETLTHQYLTGVTKRPQTLCSPCGWEPAMPEISEDAISLAFSSAIRWDKLLRMAEALIFFAKASLTVLTVQLWWQHYHFLRQSHQVLFETRCKGTWMILTQILFLAFLAQHTSSMGLLGKSSLGRRLLI